MEDRHQSVQPTEPTTEDYQQLIGSFSQAIWQTDTAGIITEDSPTWRAYTGQTLPQWLEEGWTAAIHPDDRTDALRQWQQALKARISFSIEVRTQNAASGWRWTKIRASPVRDPDGAIRKWIGLLIDLTEKKQTETALAQSEERFQSFVTATSDVVYQMSTDWREMRQLVGKSFLPDTSIPTISWLELYIPNADQAEVQAAIDQAIQTKLPFELAHRVIQADGNIGWTFSRAIPIFNAQGEITEWFGTAHDITAQKQVEEALKDSEKRLQLAIEAAHLATWEWDLTTNLVYWNEQHFLLFGMVPQREPLSSEAFVKHVHPQDRAWLTDLLTKTIQEQSSYDADFRIIRDDGITRWMHGYGYLTSQLADQPLRMSGVMFDITDWKETEEALRTSEARQRAILESAKDYAIFTTDLARNIDSWNPGAQTVFGYAEADIMHQSADRLFTPEDRQQDAPQNESQKAMDLGRAENERWHIRQDGSHFYGSGVVTPLRDRVGTTTGLLKVMRDLTDQKRADEALKESDRRKDEFLAMLAHELRNPMATIRNGLTLFSLSSEPDTMTGQAVAMMNRQVDHLVHMVDDLLDVSRISRGKIELKLERVELGALLSATVEALRPQYEARQKQLHLASLTDELFLQGDVTRLSQVITNLLTNGLRYTGDQGEVWVSLTAESGEAVIRIVDNGIGLSSKQLVTIFDLFVQGDNSLARSQGGLGVGLTLAKRLVELHKGRLEAHSLGLGQGSEFVIYLPLLSESKRGTKTVDTNHAAKAAEQRILVIDDNPDAALTLSMLLKMKGYEVHSRLNGREGIKATETLNPTLIICDIGMPDLDGIQTCRLIRQQPWGKAITIVALTGYGQEEDKQRTKEAGFDDHLVKPVDLAVLLQLVANLPVHQ